MPSLRVLAVPSTSVITTFFPVAAFIADDVVFVIFTPLNTRCTTSSSPTSVIICPSNSPLSTYVPAFVIFIFPFSNVAPSPVISALPLLSSIFVSESEYEVLRSSSEYAPFVVLLEVSTAVVSTCCTVLCVVFVALLFEQPTIASPSAIVINQLHIFFLFFFILHLVSKMGFLFMKCIII